MSNQRSYFGYVRVSTVKQGDHGVSLPEQRDAIQRFADRQGLAIVRWFEERETAAKRGRPVFSEMLNLLRAGRAGGVVVHKVDRSARNLWDWAQLGALIDEGIEVRFANEDLDLRSRSGRLSADIQAVIAADYIRNLREETKKGMQGRLKQGLYPLPAPLGYINNGGGKPKTPDSVAAPLIRMAFELYAGSGWTLRAVRDELHRLGLRCRGGGRLSLNGLSLLLRNPFYIGIVRLRNSGDVFEGIHQPIVSKTLYHRVQERIAGRVRTTGWKHEFLFRRLITCRHCGMRLIGERQKGHAYYRCHTQRCKTKSLREEIIEADFLRLLESIAFSEAEQDYMRQRLRVLSAQWTSARSSLTAARALRSAELGARLERLTDAFLDAAISREEFMRRKEALLMERKVLESHEDTSTGNHEFSANAERFLELASSARSLYRSAGASQKRQLVEITTSNRLADGKSIEFSLAIPFSLAARSPTEADGSPTRSTPRTLDEFLDELVKYFGHESTTIDRLVSFWGQKAAA